MRLAFFIILSICLNYACNNVVTDQVRGNLGILHHEFSISEAARPAFDKGLLLLHSFEYDDSGEAFEEAINADSSELMAYWGAVMTKYKALWGLQDVEAGRAIMAKVGATTEIRLEQAENELEKDFWQGLEILFGTGELSERNERFSDHMAKLYDKYPGNEEVAAFYAISLLWAGGSGFDEEKSQLSARIADGILKENPRHPGALHYKIHAFDHPEFAAQAQLAADEYANVAPDATHALHMPSHIYLALGRWDDVVASNEVSYAASVARIERKHLTDAARGFHSYAWLHYGYLQQGRYQDAERLLKDMYEYERLAGNASARSYLITMQNAQLAEAPAWAVLDPKTDINTDDLGIISQAGDSFFKAHWAFINKDRRMVEHQIQYLEGKIKTARMLVGEDGIAMCSAGVTRYAPNENSIRIANTLLLQQKAFASFLEGDFKRFEEMVKEAVTLESQCEYSFGPPDIASPSFEQYGFWLLDQNRPQEALDYFDKSLERAPGRARALLGKVEALSKLNMKTESENVKNKLKEIWKQADSEALTYLAAI